MRSSRALRSPVIAAPIAALLFLAACGSGDDSGSPVDTDEAGAATASADEDDGEVLTTAGVDLGGVEVDPAAEVETNLFPDLVVDDIGRGKKVNIRNIVPADKPVLLWMWAPH